MANPKISNEEALIGIIEQMSKILFYFNSDEGMTESEISDLEITATDLVDVILMSLNFEVKEVLKDGEIIASVKVRDIEEFLQELFSE